MEVVSKVSKEKIELSSSANKSNFDKDKIQAVVNSYWHLYYGEQTSAPDIKCYQDFVDVFPPMSGKDYSLLANKALEKHKEVPLFIGGSSGTSGESKLVLERTKTPDSRPSEDDIQLITELRMSGALNPGDIVVNLFMVGMYSILHHGFNRLLEACYCSVIPLSTLNPEHTEAQLSFMKKTGVNVLVGTPGTLIQMAHAVQRTGIQLDITRIMFTGERMGAAKASVLKKTFPSVRIIGCYGLSECGFVAIEQFDGRYKVRDSAYFIEQDNNDNLLITCLNPDLPTPIIRYQTGDNISFNLENDSVFLDNIDRADTSFNFIGNLIDVKNIRTAVYERLNINDVMVEVELNTDKTGRDNLHIKLLSNDISMEQCEEISSLLCSQEDFREGLDKDACTIEVSAISPEKANLSARNKHRFIVDNRN